MDALVDLEPRELRLERELAGKLRSRSRSAGRESRSTARDTAAAALEGATGRLTLTVLIGSQAGSYPGWIHDRTAVLAEPAEGQLCRLVVVPIGSAATRIARTVELGPRPWRPYPELVVISSDRLAGHLASREPLDGDEARTRLDLPGGAPPDLAAAIGALAGGVRRHWRLLTEDVSDNEPLALLEVLDAGPGGYWQLLPAAEPGCVLLATSSATVVWSELTAALDSLDVARECS